MELIKLSVLIILFVNVIRFVVKLAGSSFSTKNWATKKDEKSFGPIHFLISSLIGSNAKNAIDFKAILGAVSWIFIGIFGVFNLVWLRVFPKKGKKVPWFVWVLDVLTLIVIILCLYVYFQLKPN